MRWLEVTSNTPRVNHERKSRGTVEVPGVQRVPGTGSVGGEEVREADWEDEEEKRCR
jgi:hypothetical protein